MKKDDAFYDEALEAVHRHHQTFSRIRNRIIKNFPDLIPTPPRDINYNGFFRNLVDKVMYTGDMNYYYVIPYSWDISTKEELEELKEITKQMEKLYIYIIKNRHLKHMWIL